MVVLQKTRLLQYLSCGEILEAINLALGIKEGVCRILKLEKKE